MTLDEAIELMKVRLQECNGDQSFDGELDEPREVISAMQQAQATIAEQATIIDKLPKTADGVVIVPGMTLFLPPDLGGGEVCPITQCYRMHLDDAETNSWEPEWDAPYGTGVSFSTREAALATREGK